MRLEEAAGLVGSWLQSRYIVSSRWIEAGTLVKTRGLVVVLLLLWEASETKSTSDETAGSAEISERTFEQKVRRECTGHGTRDTEREPEHGQERARGTEQPCAVWLFGTCPARKALIAL